MNHTYAAIAVLFVTLIICAIMQKREDERQHWREFCFYMTPDFVCPTCGAAVNEHCHRKGKRWVATHWSRVKLAKQEIERKTEERAQWLQN